MPSAAALLYMVVYLYITAAQAAVVSARSFTEHNDTDGRVFQLRLLPKLPRQVGSCYELRKGAEQFNFCYPAIHVAGVAKCGTSAMYAFLAEHKGMVKAHHSKEYCPRASLVDYFKAFKSDLGERGKISVNGCIASGTVRRIHKILKPEAAYILTVRSLADRMWAAFNFWCTDILDTSCSGARWTKEGMYRTPELFHELIVSRASPDSKSNQPTCSGMANYYTKSIQGFDTSSMEPPHVVTMDAFSLPNAEEHLLRMQDYINARLDTNITLDPAHLHRVNTGDHKGAGKIDTAAVSTVHEEGLYKLSGHRHMLPETVAYITECWTECRNISALTHYSFNCSQSA